MHTIKTIAAIAATAVALSATTAMADTVTFFEHSHFQGNAVTITVNPLVKECYNIVNCFNDRASSAAWNMYSLPYNAQVIFYTDQNCDGDRRAWPSLGAAPPNNFAIDGINDAVSSIQVGEWRFTITPGKNVDACPRNALLGVAETNGTAMNAAENGTAVAQEKTSSVIEPST